MATAPTTPPADGAALPTPPSTASPGDFDTRGDAFLGALPAFQTEENALKANVYTNATNAYNNTQESLTAATTATTQAGIATTQAGLAAASAATAASAPGTNATSTTSMTVGLGAKAFTLAQTGKAFVVGQWVSVADSTTPTVNWMLGAITAFNSGSGAITVTVTTAAGTLTGTSWVVAAAAPVSNSGLPVTVVSGTSQTAVANNHYILTNVAASTLTLPASPTSGDMVWVTWANSLATNTIARNGQTIMGVAEDMTLDTSINGTVQLRFVNSSWRQL